MYETPKVDIVAKRYGGATSSSVLILDWPKVATRVGMKEVTAPALVLVMITSL
jgi:hypothetical protein